MTDSYYVFGWAEMATEDLCRELARIAGVTHVPKDLASLIGHTLALVGSYPVTTANLSADQRTTFGRRLFLEACRHTLGTVPVRFARRGYVMVKDRVVDCDRVNVNIANAVALAALPGVGHRIAERIVEERRTGGSFRSLEDFDKRVKGIGEELASALQEVLAFSSPVEAWHTVPYASTDLPDCLRTILSLTQEGDPEARVLRALEIIASACAERPHPSVRQGRLREYVAHDPVFHATDAIHLLSGAAYYDTLLERFASARKSVAVCMFHIAMPAKKHPTRRLLDGLIGAHSSGAVVRVLVDRDMKGDPYRSEVINQAALEYLEGKGIPCRSDGRDRLLHSKFIVIDEADVIIGSHNWSAGSYFQFDDVSVLVSSKSYASAMMNRYEALWEVAS